MEGQSRKHRQRVVLVHDTFGGVKTNAMKWIVNGFKLKAGDTFTVLSVIHRIHHPMGYKIRVNNFMFGTNQKIIDDEIAKKKREYDDNLELVQISKLYEMQKIDFKIELFVGPPKKAAVEASKKLKATWVILDRKMKKDKKSFLEELSCGVSGLNRNEEIIKIRGPKRSTRVYNRKLLYGKMLPVGDKFRNRETEEGEDLFSINFDSSYHLTTTYNESIEQAPSIGNMVGINRGNSEIGSVDLSYDAPPSYNDVAPRARSQIDEYSGVSELFERFLQPHENSRKMKKINNDGQQHPSVKPHFQKEKIT